MAPCAAGGQRPEISKLREEKNEAEGRKILKMLAALCQSSEIRNSLWQTPSWQISHHHLYSSSCGVTVFISAASSSVQSRDYFSHPAFVGHTLLDRH